MRLRALLVKPKEVGVGTKQSKGVAVASLLPQASDV